MEELNDKYPNLSKITKKHAFDVPEGYFDRLPLEVQQRCNDDKKNNLFSISLKSPVFRLTMGLAVFLSLFFLFQKNHKQEPMALSSSELMSYVEQEEIINFDQDMLAEESVREELVEQQESNAMAEQVEVEDYLIKEGVSQSDIIDEIET